MTKQTFILVAVAGSSFLIACQTHAQTFGYAPDDLLLNFRNTASITAQDLEINMGPISAVAALKGTQVVVPASVVQGVYGSPNISTPIGFSAAAADASGTTGTLWLTRADSTPGSPPANSPGQQVLNAQNLVAARIDNIGSGANAGTIMAQGQATVPGATEGLSYQSQAEQAPAETAQAIINYGGDENIATSKGGIIESIQNGTSPVYEALWEVPVTGTPNTYLGYFTFNVAGEVDFTPASVVSQIPVTLSIVPSGTNGVQILWPDTGNYTLQQNGDISASGWVASGFTVSTSNGTNTVTVTPTIGNQFFRLIAQ